MGWGYRPYVSVAARQSRAAAAVKKAKKKGEEYSPVIITGRSIANSFWGKAWCDHIEGNCDYSNRLSRGRSYARNGSVIDLKIKEGAVEALVSGSSLYTVSLTITPLKEERWQQVVQQCQGKITSIVELLQGRLSDGVMTVVTDKSTGIFPSSREIDFSCSCPDWAMMCKHVAAVIYGVGSRLDSDPSLLFTLRGVDQTQLLSTTGLVAPSAAASIDENELSDIFGIDIEPSVKQLETVEESTTKRSSKRVATKRTTAVKAELENDVKRLPQGKKAVGRKGTAKKAASSKAAAKKASPKSSTKGVRKAAPKKGGAKKSTAKAGTAKKGTAKRAAADKSTSQRTDTAREAPVSSGRVVRKTSAKRSEK